MRYGKLPIRDSDEVIAMGDIHGDSGKLRGMLKQVTPFLDKNPKCHLVFCGDYCNDGVNTPRTLDMLMALNLQYPGQVFFIRGNHEEMLTLTLMENFRWASYTQKTLEQMVVYWKISKTDIKSIAKFCLKKGVVDFLDELLPYYESNDVVCTHAPLDPTTCQMNGMCDRLDDLLDEKPTENYVLDEMSYELRWEFTGEDSKLSQIKGMEKYHICGHQYIKYKKHPRIFRHRAFIDTGCGKHVDNPLTAIKFPGKKIFQQYEGKEWLTG